MIGDGSISFPEIPVPTILSPLDGVMGLSVVLGLVVSVNAFVSAIPGLVLAGADIELRTQPNGGGTLVYSSSSVLTIPALTMLTGNAYFIRVRYRAGSFTSGWSKDIAINT